jgi:hypothetical protein
MRRSSWYAVGLCLCSSAVAAGQPLSRAARPVSSLPIETRRALAAELAEVIKALPSDSAPVCLTLPGGPPAFWYSPPSRLLASLRTGSRRVVGPIECPPTYELMFALVDSSGRSIDPVRPPGYTDPHDLVVYEYHLVGADSATLRATASQGTTNRHFRCSAHRGVDRMWRASCGPPELSISALPPNVSLPLTGDCCREAVAATALVRSVNGPHFSD